MRFGDALETTLKKLGAPSGDTEMLRLEGNRLTDVASQVAGWSGNNGMISSGAIEFPLGTIQTVTLTSPSTQIDFSVIPNRYNHLWLYGTARSDLNDIADTVWITFNDAYSTGLYAMQSVMGFASGTADEGHYPMTGVNTFAALMGPTISASGSPAGAFDPIIGMIPNSRNPGWKSGIILQSLNNDGTNTYIYEKAFWFSGAGPIKKISLWPASIVAPTTHHSFVAGTAISLIGIV